MKTGWYYLNSGAGGAEWNMALDEALLEAAAQIGNPILRFYSWSEPAASFGYFQSYREIESWTRLRPLVRRPTGGGLVPHDRDWTYSLVFPPNHEWHGTRAEESYRRAHDWISKAFAQVSIKTELSPSAFKEIPGQCFAGAEKFDLLFSGKKIAGAAQRRNKHGLLIQGSVQDQPRGVQRTTWEAAMLEIGSQVYSVEWIPLQLPPAVVERAEFLRDEKYGTEKYYRKK
jgi:lipoate-protein ligase A